MLITNLFSAKEITNELLLLQGWPGKNIVNFWMTNLMWQRLWQATQFRTELMKTVEHAFANISRYKVKTII